MLLTDKGDLGRWERVHTLTRATHGNKRARPPPLATCRRALHHGRMALSLVITGASSGIGAALAREYAAPGVTLYLSGRDAGRLDAVATACAGRGGQVRASVLDVADTDAGARWIADCDAATPLDLVVANAGISAGTGGRGIYEESHAMMRRIFDVNVGGTLNIVIPAIARMRARGRGQIAIMSSLISFIGAPGAGAYCASKAAQRLLGESLRLELAGDGVRVSVVCPGFVRTPMTSGNRFPMPFLMDADKAARIIRRGLAANRARIAFPLPMYLGVLFAAALPPALSEAVMRRFPRKD
ncbi:MAG TPA: SDR family NAD(P)-dependent oxidoreductase [Alphaproteobacteria bacterium]|nr:SDR family NAD(P)-dependent oxidoreductase [Alphaproteobacteria bacterium]